MNHKITIKNLGPIKEIKNFDVKNINAVIGESAAGKSLLAKAIFAFNELDFANSFFKGVDAAKEELKSNIRLLLSPYRNFTITYNYGKRYVIDVECFRHDKIIINFSEKLEKNVAEIKGKIEQIQMDVKIKNLHERLIKLKQSNQPSDYNAFQKVMKDISEIEDSEDNTIMKSKFLKNLNILNTIYIPATRSFVSDFDDLRLNYISKLPHIIKHEKGGRTIIKERLPDNDVTLIAFSQIYRAYIRNFTSLKDKIMRGNVEKGFGRSLKFTTVGGQRLNISEVSSGQKELFPILMILQEIEKREDPCLVIIEEPEAHIFPTDQKFLLDRIIEFANKTQSRIFLTTHSPYILMAMNNLIEANTSNYKILKDQNKYIDFNEANVQMIAKGKSKNILDKKDKLIDLDYIEKVEDEIIEEFQKMLQASNGKR